MITHASTSHQSNRSRRAWRRGAVLGAIALLVLVAACTQALKAPIVTMPGSGRLTPGAVTWHELITTDAAAAERFYGGLFDWSFASGEIEGVPRTVILADGRPIGGIIDLSGSGRPESVNQWLTMLSVTDVDAAAETTRRSGGTVHLAPVDVPQLGRAAVLADPQGAAFGVVTRADGDVASSPVEPGQWLWAELWTRSVPPAVSFYRSIAPFSVTAMTLADGQTYEVLESDGVPRAGVLALPATGVSPNWLPYIRVADVGALVNRVSGLGGRVVIAPDPSLRGGTVAVIADPAGAVLAIQEWPVNGGGGSS